MQPSVTVKPIVTTSGGLWHIKCPYRLLDTESVTGQQSAATPPSGVRIAGQRLALLDRVRIYACGITPYDVTHLGHASTFVWVDVLARVLRHVGFEPEVCRNVTDVDDVLQAAAQRAGKSPDWFAAVGQFHFDSDMTELSVRTPRHEPRAHRYVDQVIRLAAILLDADAAYVVGGSVYFRGGAVAEQSGLDRETALALAAEYGGQVDDPAKEDPLDVAVWQVSATGEPAWDSPWGQGRPGWHVECAAMALSVFGVGVDIHAGGADLRFPHHAYHAAMAEAVTGVRPYARSWLHIGTVTVDGAKMAKSTGNLVLVSDLLKQYPAALIRLMILDRRWNETWDYCDRDLEVAGDRLERLYRAAARAMTTSDVAVAEIRDALRDDLNVPAALDLAIAGGGSAARTLVSILGLS